MNSKSSARRVTIVGGGFSGACVAVQLVRASQIPLAITIVEARANIGGGLAHSADDPDHRLNGPAFLHYVDPSDPVAFDRWCEDRGVLRDDPAARVADGSLYVRRKVFGAYVAETVQAHANGPNGSTIQHVQDVAVRLARADGVYSVRTGNGQTLLSDMVVVATGNALPRLPAEFISASESGACVIAAPTDLERVRAIPKTARVLVLGSGLTALDILSTLVRAGHEGPITSVSRRGLRPAPQRPPSPTAKMNPVFHWPERIDGPVAPFLLQAGNPPTVRKLVRALRDRIREVEATGDLWYTPYDQVRDSLWQVWPTLPLDEKRRFLRKVRNWFDAFRYRSPPQNEAMVRDAETAGQVMLRTTRIRSVERAPDGAIRVVMRDRGAPTDRTEVFDAVVNCTGLDPAGGARANPFLASLIQERFICVDSTGVGFAADAELRAIAPDGHAQGALRLVGPPTSGTFADQVGIAFIAAHVRRALPSLLATLGALPAKTSDGASGDALLIGEFSA